MTVTEDYWILMCDNVWSGRFRGTFISDLMVVEPWPWRQQVSLTRWYWTSRLSDITSYVTYKISTGSVSVCSNISIHSSMALQLFVGPWPFLQLRNLFYTNGKASWMSDQPIADRYLHILQYKHRINAHIDIQVLRRIQTHSPNLRASEEVPALDHAATVTGVQTYK
jgi:hypothetical protein